MLDGRKAKIGSIGCFVSGALFTSSPFLGIPIEIAYGLFSFSVGIGLWGIYDRGRKSHREVKERIEESAKIIDETFNDINPVTGKKVPILRKPSSFSR